MKTTLLLPLLLFGLSAAHVINDPSQWDSSTTVRILKDVAVSCDSGNDPFACAKLKLVRSLDTILNSNDFQLSEHVEVRSNGLSDEGRASNDPEDFLFNYLRSHDVTMKFPGINTNVMVSGRSIDTNELDVKFQFSSDVARSGEEGRRNRMKKIIIPIMVLILLKAMTVIPLALGVLGLKAFNSLQLGFISFLVSTSLAIFQICKKLAVDHSAPHIVTHPHWDVRQMEHSNEDAQNLVYNAYV